MGEHGGCGLPILEDTVLTALRQDGFALRQFPCYLRLVKGRCEIHVKRQAQGFSLAIPIVRLGPDRPVTDELASYLADRNCGHKGPGLFQVKGGSVWYEAAASVQDLTEVALSMQKTVERLGPRILNILG